MPNLGAKGALRTSSLALREAAERKYRWSLKRVFSLIRRSVEGAASPDEIVSALRNVSKQPVFRQLCEQAAGQMATALAVGEKRTWREAASASTQGRRIFEALRANTAPDTAVGMEVREIVRTNAQLISSVPEQIAVEFSELARKRKFEGVRASEIAKEMQARAPDLTGNQAKLIARTEASKAMTALTQTRAQSIGADWYIWRTARDGERVRESHRHMEGVLCRWSDPPAPEGKDAYHPGGIYNCRCVAIPVLDVRDIPFPVKVWDHGAIISVGNAKEFIERFGVPGKAA